MKKFLWSIISALFLVINVQAKTNGILTIKPVNSIEISPEIKLQFSSNVSEARKFIMANPKATFSDFCHNFLNTKGFASKEAEALFIKVYEFAKLPPKAIETWDYKELTVLVAQIQSNLGALYAKGEVDINSLISTGPYNPAEVTSKWPWKQIILAIIDIIKDLLTNSNPNSN